MNLFLSYKGRKISKQFSLLYLEQITKLSKIQTNHVFNGVVAKNEGSYFPTFVKADTHHQQ